MICRNVAALIPFFWNAVFKPPVYSIPWPGDMGRQHRVSFHPQREMDFLIWFSECLVLVSHLVHVLFPQDVTWRFLTTRSSRLCWRSQWIRASKPCTSWPGCARFGWASSRDGEQNTGQELGRTLALAIAAPVFHSFFLSFYTGGSQSVSPVMQVGYSGCVHPTSCFSHPTCIKHTSCDAPGWPCAFGQCCVN